MPVKSNRCRFVTGLVQIPERKKKFSNVTHTWELRTHLYEWYLHEAHVLQKLLTGFDSHTQ